MTVNLNLGCGLRTKGSKEWETWINVDKFKHSGVDLKLDLFKFPYPWKNDSIDHVHCAHFLEHIPHDIRPYSFRPWPWEHWKKHLLSLDGFFAFFEEIYRILKPDGTITIVFPFGWTDYALMDPTHTRYIVPQAFGYLWDEGEKQDFDYGFKCRFGMVSEGDLVVELNTEMDQFGLPLTFRSRYMINAALNATITLRAVK